MKVEKRANTQPAIKAPEKSPTTPMTAKAPTGPAIAKDAVAVKLPSDGDEPVTPEAPKPEAKKSLGDRFMDFMFGNTENKLFMVKFNSLHFKEKVLGLVKAIESGPVAKVVDLAKAGLGHLNKLKGLAAAKFAAAGSEAGALSKVLSPLGKAGGFVFKAFEKAAPLFGWLVAGQDSVSAYKSFDDKKASGMKRGLLTATAAFSLIGAAASTIALSAGAMAAIGVSAPVLGAVAIACFGGSLLAGWLAGKQKPAETK